MSVRFSFQGPRQRRCFRLRWGRESYSRRPTRQRFFEAPERFLFGGLGRVVDRPRVLAFAVSAAPFELAFATADGAAEASAAWRERPPSPRRFRDRRTSQTAPPLSRWHLRGDGHYAVGRRVGQGDNRLFSSANSAVSDTGVIRYGRACRRPRGSLTGYPHVDGRWKGGGFDQGFQRLVGLETLGRAGFSTGCPHQESRSRGAFLRRRAACGVWIPGRGRRKIVGAPLESKGNDGPCALLSHRFEIVMDFRVQPSSISWRSDTLGDRAWHNVTIARPRRSRDLRPRTRSRLLRGRA